jgi:hypothetical protein
MAISLYDATVACFLQTLSGVEGFMERGLTHCTENGIDPNELVDMRLTHDMLPFRYQIIFIAHQSKGAIEGVKNGLFSPGSEEPPLDYKDLQGLITGAQTYLKALTREEVEALQDKDVMFQFRDIKMPFTGAGFLLSFSLPNFHFHATTAYDILRVKGVPLSKRDYLGPLPVKT